MLTYNHAKFIGAAIESVLAQRCDVPVELLVGDDVSTDGTRGIVEEYASRYPGVIRCIFPPANIGSHRNMAALLQAARGEFVAFLEGDDHWTDPDKLALQIGFLNAHPDCAMVHHRIAWWREDTGSISREMPEQEFRTERTDGTALAALNFIGTATVLLRRHLLPTLTPAWYRLPMGDWPTWAHVAEHGCIGYIDRTMATYRLHSGGIWSNLAKERKADADVLVYAYLITNLSTKRARRAWASGLLWYCLARHRDATRAQRARRLARDLVRAGPATWPALTAHLLRASARRLTLAR